MYHVHHVENKTNEKVKWPFSKVVFGTVFTPVKKIAYKPIVIPKLEYESA